MAMRKSDIEQENTKRSKDTTDDFLDDESGMDDPVNDIEVNTDSSVEMAARKRLEEYMEEKRLQKELDDDLFDF